MAFLVVVLAVVLAAMWQLWNMMRNARREATEARLGNMAMDGGYQADHKDGRGMVQSDGERYEVGTDNIPHELDTGVNHTA
ncbi:hypothetical protein FH972_021587 [Carpinus fangiana]|uniref:Uncharacterized protein n=1 Tax=Carpinus fangiana TaxID=176857 RepID=A0A5N6KQ42_9ROSI|nr:hypothetical protein FH972_021587 [Carpinus fangiana]